MVALILIRATFFGGLEFLYFKMLLEALFAFWKQNPDIRNL